jgi:hypothetical protein
MAFHRGQFRDLVGRVLKQIDLFSEDAVELVMGTVALESAFGTYLKQTGGGPAVGCSQIERATYKDLWQNFLKYKPELAAKVKAVMVNSDDPANHPEELEWNIALAIAMTRIFYLRVPEKLPSRGDLLAMERYHKKYYNTALGATRPGEFSDAYRKYCS